MRIKRLDIVGFKSFMDKTVVAFDDGVTGVVGPNGCGKSNVADAIKWVLGEQSARTLRGRSMEDVIFNGSESKPPLSMAEVQLTFLNDRPGEVPVQYQGFGEITVGRRLFRTGESEYTINKAACRLMDVTDLFMGSGVGRTAYSIIEQGRIGQIVSARPEDRRAIIEEAAGITKYKKRREAAERKMEATQQNLLRVADIVQELGKQLESLNRQARKAEKYKALKSKIRELELHQASFRFLELTATRRGEELRGAEVKAEEQALAAKVQELEAGVERDRAALAEGDARLTALVQREHELESTVKVSQVSVEAAARELEQIAERTRLQALEVEGLEAQADGLVVEREALAKQLAELGELSTGDAARLAGAEEALRALAVTEGALSQDAEAARAAASAALGRAAAERSQLAALERQRLDVKGRVERARAEWETLSLKAVELDGRRASWVEKLGRTRQLKLHLEEERGAQEDQLERARSEFIQNEAKLITLREELSDKRARLVSLSEVMKNYEGYGRGVKSIMTRAQQMKEQQAAEAAAAEQGVFGLVADVVQAPKEYENAVEAVLGEKLQYVIVESHKQGVESVSWLKSASEGRASLIPMAHMREDHLDRGEVARDRPGFIAPALEVVNFDPNYEKVVKYLLGDAVIVRDLPSALEIWQANGHQKTLVTLDGEVVDPHGVVTGGTLEGEGHGVLQRRREVQELSEIVRAMEAEFSLAQEKHRTLQARLLQLEAAIKGLDKDGREKELALLDQEKDLARIASDLEQLSNRQRDLDEEKAKLDELATRLGGEEEEHRLAAATAGAEQQRAEERAREAVGGLDEVKQRGEALTQELMALKVKVAADAERRESLSGALRRAADGLAELEERRNRLRTAMSEQNARATELKGRLDGTAVDIERLAAELARAHDEAGRERAGHERAMAATREREAALRELRKQLEAAAQALSELTLAAREHALELTHLEESVRERCQAELKHEVHRFHMSAAPGDGDRQELDDLKAQVERMGAINLTAIDEYDELSKRHDFMLAQKADLERSMADLKAAIVKIDAASRERFRETFDRVNEKFQQVFPRLFNGGRAGLVLTQESGRDPLDGGVEIFSQPPGKKLQSVNLLSGGEKALTAVGLIFAIFLIKPTPFCLLDEVDAPLDEANVGRYNEMVKEMSKASQFILITHNKHTMEMVDTLYGVTMEEPGVSKLVSVRLSDKSKEAAAA